MAKSIETQGLTLERLHDLFKKEIYSIIETKYLIENNNLNLYYETHNRETEITASTPANGLFGYANWLTLYQYVNEDFRNNITNLVNGLRKNAEHQIKLLNANSS